jgi:Flp pilus assembly pilin Flp
MQNFKLNRLKEDKGVTIVEYSVLAGLVGTLSIGVLLYMGTSVSETFVTADNSLASARIVADLPNVETGNETGNTGDTGEETDPGVECYVETSFDDTAISFEDTNAYTCFFTSNGTDTLTINRNGPIEVTADTGIKRIRIEGVGEHTININSVDPSSSFFLNTGTIVSSEGAGDISATAAINLRGISSLDTSSDVFMFDLSDENDTIELVGQSYRGGTLGGGDDSLNIRGVSGARDGYWIELGEGNDTVNLECEGIDTALDNSVNYSFNFENRKGGSTTATTSKCSSYWEQKGTSDVRNFDLTQLQSSQYTYLDQRTPYTAISATGFYSGTADFRIDSLDTIQQGPVTLDLKINNNYLVNGRQNVKVHVAPDRTQDVAGSNSSSAFPVDVKVDTSASASAGSTVDSEVRLDFSTGNSTVEYIGTAAGAKRMFLGFGNSVNYPNQGVATLISETPVALEVSMQGTCWPVTVHAKPFTGFSDITSSGSGCTYSNINNGTVFNNLSSYGGVSMTAPNGEIISFGFNGGVLKNGITLSLSSLKFVQYNSNF